MEGGRRAELEMLSQVRSGWRAGVLFGRASATPVPGRVEVPQCICASGLVPTTYARNKTGAKENMLQAVARLPHRLPCRRNIIRRLHLVHRGASLNIRWHQSRRSTERDHE